jgi:putative transposase
VIHSLKKAYPIASMCALVGVARSSYYAFARLRGERPHTTEVLDAARQIHTESRRNFGCATRATRSDATGLAP